MTDYIDIYCRTCKTWFKQRVVQHIEGHGCVLCSKSKLELNICNLFDTNNIDYEYQKRFKWLGKQSLDFYLDSLKIGIECQ